MYVLQELYPQGADSNLTPNEHRKNLKKAMRKPNFKNKVDEFHTQIWPGIPATCHNLRLLFCDSPNP